MNDVDPTASIAAATGLALVIAAGGSTDEAVGIAQGAIKPVGGSGIVTSKRQSRTTSQTSFTARVARPKPWST